MPWASSFSWLLGRPARGWRETAWLLLLPPLATAMMTLAAAVFAQSPGRPLAWAKLIAGGEADCRARIPPSTLGHTGSIRVSAYGT